MSVNDRKKTSNFVKLLVVQAAGMFLMLFPPLVLVARQKVATPGAASGELVLGQLVVEIRRWKRGVATALVHNTPKTALVHNTPTTGCTVALLSSEGEPEISTVSSSTRGRNRERSLSCSVFALFTAAAVQCSTSRGQVDDGWMASPLTRYPAMHCIEVD